MVVIQLYKHVLALRKVSMKVCECLLSVDQQTHHASVPSIATDLQA